MKPFKPFYNANVGHVVDDGAGNYKGECVSLVKRWLIYNGWPSRHGDAIMWQYNGQKPYTWIKNHIWSIPKEGDMVVFQGGQFGHIGIAQKGCTIKKLIVFNQNWPHGHDTDPCKTTVFDYKKPKCIGWLRHTG